MSEYTYYLTTYKGERKEYSSKRELAPDLYATVGVAASQLVEDKDRMNVVLESEEAFEVMAHLIRTRGLSEPAPIYGIFREVFRQVYRTLDFTTPDALESILSNLGIEFSFLEV